MKKCTRYTGLLTVMACFTIIFSSPGCGESYRTSGSGDEVPELTGSDGAVHMAPNAFVGNLGKGNQNLH